MFVPLLLKKSALLFTLSTIVQKAWINYVLIRHWLDSNKSEIYDFDIKTKHFISHDVCNKPKPKIDSSFFLKPFGFPFFSPKSRRSEIGSAMQRGITDPYGSGSGQSWGAGWVLQRLNRSRSSGFVWVVVQKCK